MDLPQEIAAELQRAEQARRGGNEGRARVCARRAAGMAARDYLTRRGIDAPSASAYDLLTLLRTDPSVPPALQKIAGNLTLRVTEEFRLPVEADLIAEARTFCEELAGIDVSGKTTF